MGCRRPPDPALRRRPQSPSVRRRANRPQLRLLFTELEILMTHALSIVAGCALIVATLATPGRINAATPVDPYAAPNSFVGLSYHEVRDDVRDYPDPYSVDSAALV